MNWWNKLWGREAPASVQPQPASPRQVKKSVAESLGLNGEAVARILTPEDFAAIGIAGAKAPSVNDSERDSFYLVYAGRSGATGGIEFDIFFSNHPDVVFATVLGETGGSGQPVPLESADKAILSIGLPNSRGGKASGIAVLKGSIIFCIAIPDSPQAQAQLLALSRLVLDRTGKCMNGDRDGIVVSLKPPGTEAAEIAQKVNTSHKMFDRNEGQ